MIGDMQYVLYVPEPMLKDVGVWRRGGNRQAIS